jgi:sec-independent protein translocase protein TatA
VNIGPTELIVILIVALIVFGPKRLPEIGRTIGRSLQEFRRASNDLREELERDLDDQPPAGPKPSATATEPLPGAPSGGLPGEEQPATQATQSTQAGRTEGAGEQNGPPPAG